MAEEEEKNPWWNIVNEIIEAIESWWEPTHSIVSRLWRAADGYVRFAIRLIIWSSLLIIGGMVYGDLFINSLIASLPIIGVIILLARKPIVVGLIAYADKRFTKGACLRALMTIIGVELVVGIYASIFRAANDRKLIPLFLVVIFTLIVLAFAKKISFFAYAKAALWIILTVITIIWVAGGREEIKKMADTIGDNSTSQRTVGHVEDGYYVTQNVVVQPYAKKLSTRDKLGDVVRNIVNCDGKEYITTLQPRESIHIKHAFYGHSLKKQNRCSFSTTGDAVSIYGEPEEKTLPSYKNDLPFPQFEAYIIVFYLVNERGGIISAEHIKHNGGVVSFTNYTSDKLDVYLASNLPESIMSTYMSQQIGWDGSTATFEAVKY